MSRRYELCGGNLAAFRDTRSQEYLLAGPAGTGKTFTNLARLLHFGDAFPRARMLIVRKTRVSLTETALVTWERDVLGEGHAILGDRELSRAHRHAYKFPNGSVLVTAGMDKPDKVLSSEWDLIYVNEATELEEAEWEILGSRLRANAGDYDQLIGDCNPSSPRHWLYKRCQAGKCKLYPTYHYENPRYYDYRARKWTEAGRRYVHGRLKQLTGSRRERFLYGKWVAAEGAIYDYISAAHDLPAGWRPPANWRRLWAIDWGDRAPTVLQIWAVDGEGRMYLYREVFRCHLRADVLGKWVKEHLLDTGEEPLPFAGVCDHDPDKKADFERACGVFLTMADKADRDRGIQAMQARFDRDIVGHDDKGEPLFGKPRIFFADGARVHDPDPVLIDEGRPTSTVDELVEYVWDPKFVKDTPIEENDHGMDSARYAVLYVDANMTPGAMTGPLHERPASPRLPDYMGKVGSATGW
ncbi:MAG TPA: phage terminase large subunit [Gemmata sp.]